MMAQNNHAVAERRAEKLEALVKKTNRDEEKAELGLLRRVLAHEPFREGALRTDLIERAESTLIPDPPPPPAVFLAAAALLAVLENDGRRLLSYHIISQVGYMVAAVGIGTAMAINGAVAHAACHIVYKGLREADAQIPAAATFVGEALAIERIEWHPDKA